MNAIKDSQGNLIEAIRHLNIKWNKAKEVWNDAAKKEFVATFWTEFETTTINSIEKLQVIADTLAQAEREMP